MNPLSGRFGAQPGLVDCQARAARWHGARNRGTMNSETRRLNKLKDTSRNLAKRYKLPEVAVQIIEKNAKVHGQQSRAIRVAVELLWEKAGWRVPDRAMSAILDSPLTGKTYKLPPRTFQVRHSSFTKREIEISGSMSAIPTSIHYASRQFPGSEYTRDFQKPTITPHFG